MEVAGGSNGEPIYTGRNGLQVRRVEFRTPDGETLRGIFKPLTNADTRGREPWVCLELLPLIPVRAPRLLDYRAADDGADCWTLFEDLGDLNHELDNGQLVLAAEAVPLWHTLSAERVPAHYQGHTPRLDAVVRDLSEHEDEFREALAASGLDAGQVSAILCLLERMLERARPNAGSTGFDGLQDPPDQTLDEEACPSWARDVISHGDLYPLNAAFVNGELVVLDWEYVHRNSLFWDLFNLMDITGFRFRRRVLAAAAKRTILEAYRRRRAELEPGWNPETGRFVQAYARYSAIYLIWILGLIARDLRRGTAPEADLQRQRAETAAILAADLDLMRGSDDGAVPL